MKVYTREPLRHFHSSYDANELTDEFPMLTRAWCYQERILSSRMIHFTKTELVWECHQETVCQCSGTITSKFDIDAQPKITHNLALSNSPGVGNTSRAEWCRMVESFSNLNLTYPSDLFPALSGAATQMARVSGDSYVAGLWKSSFFEDLLWQCGMTVGRPGTTVRTQTWRAPMFSWGSVEGKVEYPYPVYVYSPPCFSEIPEGHKAGEHEPKWARPLKSECELLDFENVPATSDPTGKLECDSNFISSSVTVRGPVVKLKLDGDHDHDGAGKCFWRFFLSKFPPEKEGSTTNDTSPGAEAADTSSQVCESTSDKSEDNSPVSISIDHDARPQESTGEVVGDLFPDWDLAEAGPYWARTFPGMKVYCLLVGEDSHLTHQRAVVFGNTKRGYERLGVLWYKSYQELQRMAEIQTIKLV